VTLTRGAFAGVIRPFGHQHERFHESP
jgi:hypothetical protein